MKKMVTAYDKVAGKGRKAMFLVGDFNINLNTDKAQVISDLKETSLAYFEPRSSKANTHRNKQGQFVSTLDWALLSQKISKRTKVNIVKESNSGGINKITALLKLEFDNLKESDHRPIMVSWEL